MRFHVDLPTSADWGYVFRVKSDGQTCDVSIVHLNGNSFGTAIESENGLLSNISNYFKKTNIKGIKQWVEEVPTTDVGAKSIKWFTAEEWHSAFGQGIWSTAPK